MRSKEIEIPLEQVQVIMKEDEFNEISSDEEDHRDVDVLEVDEKQTLLCPIGSCKFFLSAVNNSLQQSHLSQAHPGLDYSLLRFIKL